MPRRARILKFEMIVLDWYLDDEEILEILNTTKNWVLGHKFVTFSKRNAIQKLDENFELLGLVK